MSAETACMPALGDTRVDIVEIPSVSMTRPILAVAAILTANVGMGTQAARRSRDAIARYANSVAANRTKRLVVAFLSFLLLTVVWFAPVIVHADSRVLWGPADGTLTIRGYWAINEQGATPFFFERDYLNAAPEGVPWQSAIAIVQPIQGLVVWALHPLIGFVGGFNVFLLTGFVLTGFFGFALLDRLQRIHSRRSSAATCWRSTRGCSSAPTRDTRRSRTSGSSSL